MVGGVRKEGDHRPAMEVSVIRACDGGLHPSYEGVVRGPGRRMRDRRIIIVDRRKGDELGVFWRG